MENKKSIFNLSNFVINDISFIKAIGKKLPMEYLDFISRFRFLEPYNFDEDKYFTAIPVSEEYKILDNLLYFRGFIEVERLNEVDKMVFEQYESDISNNYFWFAELSNVRFVINLSKQNYGKVEAIDFDSLNPQRLNSKSGFCILPVANNFIEFISKIDIFLF